MTTGEVPDLLAFDDAFAQDRHNRYARMREEPVQRIRTVNGLDAWLITRYEDVKQALLDPRIAKDFGRTQQIIEKRLADAERKPGFSPDLGPHMLNTDPPDHTRLRKLVVKAFTARRVEGLRPRIEQITDDLLDRLAGRSEVDLIDEFAFPLPITVISELMGVEDSRRDDFRSWTNVLVDGSQPEAQAQVSVAMVEYLTELIAKKRTEPGDDLLTALLEAVEDGDRLSEGELIAMVFLLLVAGHETTVNLIGNCVLSLLTNPGQLAALRADRSLLPGAIEETLRYESPVAHGTFRHTAEAVQFGDVVIPEGEVIWVALGAANRDGERFEEPDRFDIARETTGHVAFGHGIHFCVGAALARLEAQIAVGRLVERFPDLRMAASPDDLRWRFSVLMRGLEKLPVSPGA
ncbi:cytochrome P450 [Saccharopolyspora erythraea]|uniref:cytochrome P450 family protein n=1 Tax=Saccharopolyspora erythraea TaxID=1836 RepID=UPI001BABCC66|nr:cytochrome P450 [Saccharopolyspora erythraea]QUH00856.1 cytochrome P450 [Saccharopolyspora erythraea]